MRSALLGLYLQGFVSVRACRTLPATSDFWNPTVQIDYGPLPRGTGPLSAPAWIGGGVNPLTMR
jgi:hypothetical protein